MATPAPLQELTDPSLQLLADFANSYAVTRGMKLVPFRPRRRYMTGRRHRLLAFSPTAHEDVSRRPDESRSKD